MSDEPSIERWRIWAGGCQHAYAERPCRAEAEALVERDRHLIERFGTPIRIERVVIPFPRQDAR